MWKSLLMGLKGASGPATSSAASAAMLSGRIARTMATSNTGRGMLGGMAAGGAWGAASDDTSVLGGMAMGAGMGALGGRYGGAGYNWSRNYGSGLQQRTMGFIRGVTSQARKDWRAGRSGVSKGFTRLRTNMGFSFGSGNA